MKLLGIKFWTVVLLVVSSIQIAVVSCSDDPGVENYYTQTREYASDYLKNREQYSEYLKILERARGEYDLRLVDLLGTYGKYTIFAPTNDAVEKYLAGLGLTSVDELSVEDCDTIALNSIIEDGAFFSTDHNAGSYPKGNMLGRILSVRPDTVWNEEKQSYVMQMKINGVLITHADDSVSNGVVHTVNAIVDTPNDLIGAVILKDTKCSLYGMALEVTGIIDTLQEHYFDESYVWASRQDVVDSCMWKNKGLLKGTAWNKSNNDGKGGYNEYDNVAYTEKRQFNYTVFLCPDSILKADYDIETLDDLRAKARELYEPMYPEDADVTDERDRRNYLNRFISYHVLDRWGDYFELTFYDNHSETGDRFNRTYYDICDWYETLMPHSMMKFSYPDGPDAGLYINRRGVRSHVDERGVFVRGSKVTSPYALAYPDGVHTGLNGIYHYIDKIVAYDYQMQKVVMDDCIRMDCTTLSPDFMTHMTPGLENPRGHSGANGSKYSTVTRGSGADDPNTNNSRCVGFRRGYVRNFEMRGNTHMHVRSRGIEMGCYEADEVVFKGVYDFTVKLPPVPAGTYEVRMFTNVGFDSRGIVQVYLDDIPQGMAFDMRKTGGLLFGWKNDSDLGGNDEIAAFDKAIHNLQWMKGPKCYITSNNSVLRESENAIRAVFGTIVSDGKSDHYLRMQQKMDSDNNELAFDFIELCPSNVYNNEYYAEPVW